VIRRGVLDQVPAGGDVELLDEGKNHRDRRIPENGASGKIIGGEWKGNLRNAERVNPLKEQRNEGGCYRADEKLKAEVNQKKP